MTTAATIRQLKEDGQDYEFYPSTDAIISRVASSISCNLSDRGDAIRSCSLLDIGAGDGRVLLAVQKHYNAIDRYQTLELFAIEKARHHLTNMPKEITVIGTDFEEQSLSDRPVGAVFCNPPYSQYVEWTLKILREASTAHVYLVIPRRWRDNPEIDRAVKARGGTVQSLGEFDFEDADREARAKVEIVHINWAYESQDVFASVIEGMLPELDVFEQDIEEEATEDTGLALHRAQGDVVEYLVESYGRDLQEMLENYKAALHIKAHILKELGVEKENVLKGIRLKIKGLKDRYWKMLFEEMATIRNRLATKHRKAFLESLGNKLAIDFTYNNVYSILIWVSKWANGYFDEQVVELFQTLSTDSNVVRYKSNDRVWTKGDWRYSQYRYDRADTAPSHYKLEYRIVLSHGGICSSEYQWRRGQNNGLEECAFSLLSDIATVANNLGFDCDDSLANYQWESNKQNVLKLRDGTPLAAVRAFKNGNMHIHFNPKVMLAINVEAGRLLGWIRNPAEACDEMDLNGDEAQQATQLFGTAFKIGSGSRQLLLGCLAQ